MRIQISISTFFFNLSFSFEKHEIFFEKYHNEERKKSKEIHIWAACLPCRHLHPQSLSSQFPVISEPKIDINKDNLGKPKNECEMQCKVEFGTYSKPETLVKSDN